VYLIVALSKPMHIMGLGRTHLSRNNMNNNNILDVRLKMHFDVRNNLNLIS
jgi:hypothetical protein